jgi:hypothetical protein
MNNFYIHHILLLLKENLILIPFMKLFMDSENPKTLLFHYYLFELLFLDSHPYLLRVFLKVILQYIPLLHCIIQFINHIKHRFNPTYFISFIKIHL